MQCRYCRTKNSSSAQVCVSCNKPLSPPVSPLIRRRRTEYAGRHHVDNIRSAPHLQSDNSVRNGTATQGPSVSLPAKSPSVKGTSGASTFAPEQQPMRTTSSAGRGMNPPLQRPAEPSFSQPVGASLPPHTANSSAQVPPVFTGTSSRTAAANAASRSSGPNPASGMDSHGRQEPSLVPPPFAALNGIDPAYEKEERRRKRVARIVMMIGIFLIGVGSGLSGLWWLEHEHESPTVSSAGESTPAQVQAGSTATAAAPLHAPGTIISRDELPYDGNPPGQANVPRPAERPTAKISPEELPGDHQPILSSGSSTVDETSNEGRAGVSLPPPDKVQPDRANTAEVPPTVKSAPATESLTTQDKDTARAPQEEKSDNTQSAREQSTTNPLMMDEKKTARTSRKHRSVVAQSSESKATTNPLMMDDKKAARAAKREKSVRTSTKEAEINRIREQAGEELKKKSGNPKSAASFRGGSVSARKRSASAKTASHLADRSAAVARCAKAGNIILREKCKWQLCSGRWGRDGCPSYQTRASLQ